MIHAQGINAEFDAYLKTLDLSDEVPRLAPEEVNQVDDWMVLDARPEAEFEVAHIEGAKRIGFLPREPYVLEGIPKDRPILVYCTVGWRSGKIGAWLQSLGFTKVYNLYGGVLAWSNAGKPLQNTTGQATSRVHTYSEDFARWLKKGEPVY